VLKAPPALPPVTANRASRSSALIRLPGSWRPKSLGKSLPNATSAGGFPAKFLVLVLTQERVLRLCRGNSTAAGTDFFASQLRALQIASQLNPASRVSEMRMKLGSTMINPDSNPMIQLCSSQMFGTLINHFSIESINSAKLFASAISYLSLP
jgi:hypothetical protein